MRDESEEYSTRVVSAQQQDSDSQTVQGVLGGLPGGSDILTCT